MDALGLEIRASDGETGVDGGDMQTQSSLGGQNEVMERRARSGYVQCRVRVDHPFVQAGFWNPPPRAKTCWVYEHRLVAWQCGKLTHPGQVIHHLDFDRANNSMENLLLLSNKLRTERPIGGGRLKTGACATCGAAGLLRKVAGVSVCLACFPEVKRANALALSKTYTRKLITCSGCGRYGRVHAGHGLCGNCAHKRKRALKTNA